MKDSMIYVVGVDDDIIYGTDENTTDKKMIGLGVSKHKQLYKF